MVRKPKLFIYYILIMNVSVCSVVQILNINPRPRESPRWSMTGIYASYRHIFLKNMQEFPTYPSFLCVVYTITKNISSSTKKPIIQADCHTNFLR